MNDFFKGQQKEKVVPARFGLDYAKKVFSMDNLLKLYLKIILKKGTKNVL